MVFDPANSHHLKPWLVRTLEPICDAEPGALAEYILALLKHNVPESEMRKELAVQLDEFLEKECQPFLDTLFTVLRTKSYLPYSAIPSAPSFPDKMLDTGIPIPLDGLVSPSIPSSPDRIRKRSLDDDKDGRPAKGPRLNDDGQFSRYGSSRGGMDSRSAGGWNSRVDKSANGYREGSSQPRGASMGHAVGQMNGRRPQAYQPPDMKRGICRDYHNNGYCARGAFCKFSHGDDAVVPSQMFPINGSGMTGSGMPFMTMFGQGFGMQNGPVAAYDPHESRMDMRSMGNSRSQMRPAFLPRVDDGQTVHASGELPVIQDLTPNIPHDDVTPNPTSQTSVSQSSSPQHPSSSRIQHPHLPDINDDVANGHQAKYNEDVEMTPVSGLSQNGGYSTGIRGPTGRGRGTFGDVPGIRPEKRNDKTLVVEKIPDDKLSLEQVNDWFKKFGKVTNVAIDRPHGKALVSFEEHREAYAAWKSEDAVFNNRFVKVFWHRPMEGHGQIGARMLAASAPIVANISAKAASAVLPAASVTSPTTPIRKSSVPSSSSTITLAEKQRRLEQHIAEQKSLMASLAAASGEEKKGIMARLRKLGDEITLTSSSVKSNSTPMKTHSNPTQATDERQQQERARLDKELDFHSSVTAIEGEGETAEDLKAKLERLKAEAASLGLSDAEPNYGGSHRPYRSRGRGPPRSFYRGAGRGVGRASMKLDNRPKRLLVRGVSSEKMQALKDWYEANGQVDSISTLEDGDVVVSFRTRTAAEQGMAKGSSIPTVGDVHLSWHTDTLPPSSSTTVAPAAELHPPPQEGPSHRERHSPAPELDTESKGSPNAQEEEVIASGWGGDGEDGMGMF
ncbi:uncharacterized protein BT62DRAFT_991286 [Guyanagaster necrorhizus]|uniref:Uncharacterized protein n=1 Tax=Guyanagaster necrorhizus TaxID=856835 RepID=A0A9P7W138_9AGAR|nr:uncharacterized protein BT62DRAFT_991286 [Guyanagaster necrorhizus MCA 3950]KAG7450293.1 hypothetical protein BT62DRAFT_991286 [Guyanagaster necrorhizus MCA 3950]